MQTITIDAAKAYLREDPARRLRVLFKGQNRTIFYNSERDAFGMFLPGCTRRGHLFDWSALSAIFAPREAKSRDEQNAKAVRKFKRKAAKASFSNAFIRKCLAADETKSVYENGLSTGVPIEGDIITVKSLGTAFPWVEQGLRNAIERCKQAAARGETECSWNSGRERWRGYDMSCSVHLEPNGDICGFLNMEYKDCGNGRYYLLVNDDEFIGYDID